VLDSEEGFSAKWIPSEACEPYQDEEGRVLHRPLAENVALRIADQPAKLVSRDEKQRRQAPPLPYNLSALQIDAARRFGLSAKQVLDTSQSLYERHALITYPRSDCRYLPEGHFAQADSVCRAISHNAPSLAASVQGANTKLRSKAWSDKKVAAHHAIIPTAKRSSAVLSDVEVKVYDLICRQYVIQFYPDYRFSETQLNLLIAGGQFVAKARQLVDSGWKVVSAGGRSRKGENTDDEQSELIPAFKPGQALHCTRGDIVDKETQPPQFFTDATLLAAMTGIARYVSDPELKKTLKETDGLGTEATRAGIIELLFTRSFLHRKGKQIRATEAGIQLIAGLPEVSTKPDITARWELALNAIVEKEMTYTAFMNPLEAAVTDLVNSSASVSFKALPVSKSSFAGAGRKARRKSSGSRSVKSAAKKTVVK
jgi:DNA topoisomerase-3